ncbi:MAG: sigma factor-like helix-turn-helix DNA-binding protein [Prochloraceae cyanobacterium]
MGRPKKYQDLYGPQKAYLQTEKGKEALKRYRSSEKVKIRERNRARTRRGTIIDKQQWFIDNYGDIENTLNILDDKQRQVINLIYGLDGNEPITQKDLAERWGKSPQWISQLKKSALNKIKSSDRDLSQNLL